MTLGRDDILKIVWLAAKIAIIVLLSNTGQALFVYQNF
ncbi:hypothetical protein ACVIGB_009110 [Bradyrhizobium sp. USDA 4341]|jgi:hypothetical protein